MKSKMAVQLANPKRLVSMKMLLWIHGQWKYGKFCWRCQQQERPAIVEAWVHVPNGQHHVARTWLDFLRSPNPKCPDGLLFDSTGMMPLDFFFKMWLCELFEHIAEETNCHHEQGKDWNRRCSEYQKFISFLKTARKALTSNALHIMKLGCHFNRLHRGGLTSTKVHFISQSMRQSIFFYTPSGTPSGTPIETPSGTPSGKPSCTPSGTPSRTPSGTPSGTLVEPPVEPQLDPQYDPQWDPQWGPYWDPQWTPKSDQSATRATRATRVWPEWPECNQSNQSNQSVTRVQPEWPECDQSDQSVTRATRVTRVWPEWPECDQSDQSDQSATQVTRVTECHQSNQSATRATRVCPEQPECNQSNHRTLPNQNQIFCHKIFTQSTHFFTISSKAATGPSNILIQFIFNLFLHISACFLHHSHIQSKQNPSKCTKTSCHPHPNPISLSPTHCWPAVSHIIFRIYSI